MIAILGINTSPNHPRNFHPIPKKNPYWHNDRKLVLILRSVCLPGWVISHQVCVQRSDQFERWLSTKGHDPTAHEAETTTHALPSTLTFWSHESTQVNEQPLHSLLHVPRGWGEARQKEDESLTTKRDKYQEQKNMIYHTIDNHH